MDHPLDRGGATNKGITLKTYRQLVDANASVEDLRSLTDEDAGIIYKRHYWDALGLDHFSNQALAETVMDFGVNAGRSRSAKLLQFILNSHYGESLAVDGLVGAKTLTAANKAANQKNLTSQFNSYRERYYRFLAGEEVSDSSTRAFFTNVLRVSPNSSQRVFLKGWLARVRSFGSGDGLASVAGIIVFTALLGAFWWWRKNS